MDGLIAGSRGWTGLSLAVEVGRQHPRMDGLIAGSRGGKTTSKDGRAYRWQHPRMGLSLTVDNMGIAGSRGAGRQHPRMDGLIAGSRGGKTTSKDGRAYRWQ